MTNGYVYILFNPSMPNMVKIGMTKKEPEERIQELSSATGVPTPFILAYRKLFSDCQAAEQKIHQLLEDYRISSSREFFQIPIYKAIDALLDVHFTDDSEFIKDKIIMSVDSVRDQVRDEAISYYLGENGRLQDYLEAFKLFKRSAKLDCPVSHQYLGRMYWLGCGCRKNIDYAINSFNKSINLGNVHAIPDLAKLYSTQSGKYPLIFELWDSYLGEVNVNNLHKFKKDLDKILDFVESIYLSSVKYNIDYTIQNKDALLLLIDDMIELCLVKIENWKRNKSKHLSEFSDMSYSFFNTQINECYHTIEFLKNLKGNS